MPRYTYRCPVCEKISEINHAMSIDAKDVSCPKCKQKGNLKRLPSQIQAKFNDHIKVETGELVKQHIELTKQETEKLREEFRMEYDPRKNNEQ